MFERLKKKFITEEKPFHFPAPVSGKVVDLDNVNDPTFSERMLGEGVAIVPSGTRILSPISGEISLMFETGHAVSIISNQGMEVLIHVGLDTIALKGKHFTAHKQTGDKVSPGDLLIEFDPEGIKEDGYDVITPIILTNADEYSQLKLYTGTTVSEMDIIMDIFGEKAEKE